MGRVRITTITLHEKYFEFLEELIKKGFGDNISGAIRRCIDVVSGYFEVIKELREKGEIGQKEADMIEAFLMFLIAKSKVREEVMREKLQPYVSEMQKAIASEGGQQ